MASSTPKLTATCVSVYTFLIFLVIFFGSWAGLEAFDANNSTPPPTVHPNNSPTPKPPTLGVGAPAPEVESGDCQQLSRGLSQIPMSEWPMVESHDAASAYLCKLGTTENFGVPGTCPNLKVDIDIDWVAQIGPIAAWAVAQNQNLASQLDCGARALDLRITTRKDGTLCFHHGFALVGDIDVTEKLKEVVTWAGEQRKNSKCSGAENDLVVLHVTYAGAAAVSKGAAALKAAGIPVAAMLPSNTTMAKPMLEALSVASALKISKLQNGGHVLVVQEIEGGRSIIDSTFRPELTMYTDNAPSNLFNYMTCTAQQPLKNSSMIAIQAMWQNPAGNIAPNQNIVPTLKMLLSWGGGSNIIKDNINSKINEKVANWIGTPDATYINMLKVDNVCMQGKEMAGALRKRKMPNIGNETQAIKSEIKSSTFLANWMGHLKEVIGKSTIMDLTLPGTHDAVTYDLSQTVAQNANSICAEDNQFKSCAISQALFALTKWLSMDWKLPFFPEIDNPLEKALPIGKVIRDQAIAQKLTIQDQLESGIRFVDLRITWSCPPQFNTDPFELTSDIQSAWRAVKAAFQDKDASEAFTCADSDKQWYMQHMVQTLHPAIVFLKQIHSWMNVHPGEIVVVWMTYHGDAGGKDDYPASFNGAMQPFWKEIKDQFGNMLFDTSKHKMNETTVEELIKTGERVAMYVQEWQSFTGGDSRALDAKLLTNIPGGGPTYGETMRGFCDMGTQMDNWKGQFAEIAKEAPKSKAKNEYYVRSFTGFDGQLQVAQIVHSAALYYQKIAPNAVPAGLKAFSFVIQGTKTLSDFANRITKFVGIDEEVSFHPDWITNLNGQLKAFGFNPYNPTISEEGCAAVFGIPEMTKCPKTLLDVSQLRNYYFQIALNDSVATNRPYESGLPMALYVDAVGHSGTIRTSESKDYTTCAAGSDAKGFAFTETIILYNLQKACNATGAPGSCASLVAQSKKRQSLFPVQRWDNKAEGRHASNWWTGPDAKDICKKRDMHFEGEGCGSGDECRSGVCQEGKCRVPPHAACYKSSFISDAYCTEGYSCTTTSYEGGHGAAQKTCESYGWCDIDPGKACSWSTCTSPCSTGHSCNGDTGSKTCEPEL